MKEFWDIIGMVIFSIYVWEVIVWRDINVEVMDLECKRFVRYIRNFDKEVRVWDAFIGLESIVLNILIFLRVVFEL